VTEVPVPDGSLRAYPGIDAAWSRLKEYTGSEFRDELTDYGACCSFVEAEFARYGPRDFYRLSTGYLYELTHFHFMPHKDPFFRIVTRFAAEHGLGDLADVGCGVGLDAQALSGAGFGVTLYDFPSPSRDYAAWRLNADRGVSGVTRSLGDLGSARHELIYAVDVLEHVPDPEAQVPLLLKAADFVAVNLFGHDPRPWDGRDMHYPLNHWRLLPEFSRRAELVEVGASGDTVCTVWRSREGEGA
jgi:hypothetical protein